MRCKNMGVGQISSAVKSCPGMQAARHGAGMETRSGTHTRLCTLLSRDAWFFLPIRPSCLTRKGMDTARKTVFLLFFLVLLPVLCHAMQETEPTAP